MTEQKVLNDEELKKLHESLDLKEISKEELEQVSGGSLGSDFNFIKSKCRYAISQLRREIRDYIGNKSFDCNQAALKNAINALDLVENDVSNATEADHFMFCDRYWGTFKAYIRAARAEEFFTNSYFLEIESIIVVE